MTALYLADLDAVAENHLRLIRLVREAMRSLGVNAKAKHADAKIAEAQANGRALLGVGTDDEVMLAAEPLGILAMIDWIDDPPTPDEILAEPEALSPEEVFAGGMTPDEAAAETEVPTPQPAAEREPLTMAGYETAIALIASQEGDPLKAAAHACTLGRTVGDTTVYVDAINALIAVFPWIGPMLVKANLIDPADTP